MAPAAVARCSGSDEVQRRSALQRFLGDSRKAPVGELDVRVSVDHEDEVGKVLEETAELAFRLAQCPFRLPAPGEVAGDPQHARRHALVVSQVPC